MFYIRKTETIGAEVFFNQNPSENIKTEEKNIENEVQIKKYQEFINRDKVKFYVLRHKFKKPIQNQIQLYLVMKYCFL